MVKQGEGYTLEFKENLGKKFAVEVVALANSMGGKILIGVDDDGNIIGTDTSNNQNQTLKLKVSNLYDELSKVSFFVTPTILKKDYSEIEKYYQEEPRLLDYEIILKQEKNYQ